MQSAIVASQLRTLGYASTANVPLEVWLQLGFLNTPTAKLRQAIDSVLTEHPIGSP